MRIQLLGVVAVAAVIASIQSNGSVTAQNVVTADDNPTISSVEPAAGPPWSYVEITGSNLTSKAGECGVYFSGVRAYVPVCSPSHIRAIVPWHAKSGDVTVTADFAEQAASFDILPLVIDPKTIEPGVIKIKTFPGTNLEAIAASKGETPEAIQAIGDAGASYKADWFRLKVAPGSELEKSIEYSSDEEILYAAPSPLPKQAVVPNDTLYSQQWALPKINAPGAWDQSKGDGIKIAVIDTGFATSHTDLAGHMLPGWNCGGTQNVAPFNSSAHGTLVAGVAAAVTNTSPQQGVAGVGWNSQILPLRYYDDAGALCPNYEQVLVAKAIEGGAKVVNMSYSYNGPNPDVCDDINRGNNAGMLMVAAAGNSNSGASEDPAGCPKVVAVAATNPDDSRAAYSNYGSWIDVSAPGGTGTAPPNPTCTGDATTLIYTTNYPSDYTTTCGTSVAAPYVAGLGALLMAMGLDNCRAATTIEQTADPFPAPGWQGGTGRINAGAAVNNHKTCSLEYYSGSHNLLTNASFERGGPPPGPPWAPLDTGQVSLVDTTSSCNPTSPSSCAKAGSWYAEFKKTGANGSMYQDILLPAAAGESYVATVWMRCKVAGCNVTGDLVLWGQGAPQDEDHTEFKLTSTQWEPVTTALDVKPGQTHPQMRAQVYVDQVNVPIHVDGADVHHTLPSNASFEKSTDPSPWSPWVGSSMKQYASFCIPYSSMCPKSGVWFVEFSSTSGGGSIYQDITVPAVPGESYSVTVWLRCSFQFPAACPATGELVLYGLGVTQDDDRTEFRLTASTQWVPVTAALDVKDGFTHTKLRIQIYVNEANRPINIDGVDVHKVMPSSASFEKGNDPLAPPWAPWPDGSSMEAFTRTPAQCDPASPNSCAASGSRFVQFSKTTGGGSIYQDVWITAVPGNSYSVTVWMRCSVQWPAACPVRGQLVLFGLGGTVDDDRTKFYLTSTNWVQVTASLDVKNGLQHGALRVQIYVDEANKPINVDAVKTVSGP